MERTDNKRTTEIEKTYTNHPSTVTATPRRCTKGVLEEIKLGISDVYAVTEKNLGVQFCEAS